jgi:hypothetical protein
MLGSQINWDKLFEQEVRRRYWQPAVVARSDKVAPLETKLPACKVPNRHRWPPIMMSAIAAFLAKLTDPATIVLAMLVMTVCRSWWHVAIASVAIGAAVELILSSIQGTRTFNPVVFGIGVLAAGAWVSLAFFIKTQWTRRQSRS